MILFIVFPTTQYNFHRSSPGENNVAGVAQGVRSGCCSIGCPGPGQNACRNPCDASAVLCADYYACAFPSMINDWRSKWNGGQVSLPGRPVGPLPFLFVLLAPYIDGLDTLPDGSRFPNVALLRAAQQKALNLPATAMVSAVDWGDIACPRGNIHPRWKAPIGARLALAAAALVYNESSAAHAGPKVVEAIAERRRGSPLFDIRITFDKPVTLVPPQGVGGLIPTFPVPSSASAGCQPTLKNQTAQCAWFEVDGLTHKNATQNKDDTKALLLHVGSTQAPRQVQYAWGNWPVATVWGVDGGLPAVPFYVNVRPGIVHVHSA